MTMSFFGLGSKKLPRDINTEMVTKVLPVGAVNLSIGAFSTELSCEFSRYNDTFLDRAQLLGLET